MDYLPTPGSQGSFRPETFGPTAFAKCPKARGRRRDWARVRRRRPCARENRSTKGADSPADVEGAEAAAKIDPDRRLIAKALTFVAFARAVRLIGGIQAGPAAFNARQFGLVPSSYTPLGVKAPVEGST
jgi:hypothetical protein